MFTSKGMETARYGPESPPGGAQSAARMAEAREVNDGLRALFLPRHGRRPWVSLWRWFICPRTDGEREIVSAERHLHLRARVHLRRRTIGGVSLQVGRPRGFAIEPHQG
jgi:hypothetical protein